jgi:hypothetical protein
MQTLIHFLQTFFQELFPNKYYVPVILLSLLIIYLCWAMFKTKLKDHRPNLILIIVISTLLLIIMAANVSDRWTWMVALLPTLLVGYQAFYLWLAQPKEVTTKEVKTEGRETRENAVLAPARERALKSIDSQFGLKTLFIRYGFPAALLGIAGLVILNVLTWPGEYFSLITFIDKAAVRISTVTADKALMGLRLGALGAYVYVLLELGRRTFRHDVTGASAMWCLVTLVLGPVLAATVAVLWQMKAPQEGNWWAGGVVLFFAGYAPRRVIAAIEQAAVQLLKIGGPSGVAPTRQIPLSQIRGIGPQIEERLSEEGIEDVNALAAAEPIRLLRNTSFDLRQIVTWIDEAILIVTLPRSWQTLEEEGITGAIDLAWYEDEVHPDFETREDEKAWRAEKAKAMVDLAEKAKVSPANLIATIRRLREDRQVQDIWVLYNSFSESVGGGSGTGDGGGGGVSGDVSQHGAGEPG